MSKSKGSKQAIGGQNQGGNLFVVNTRQYSAHDMPGHLSMNTRAEYDKREFTRIKTTTSNKIESIDAPSASLKALPSSEKPVLPSRDRTEEDELKEFVGKSNFIENCSGKNDPSESEENVSSQGDSVSQVDEDELTKEYERLKRERAEQKTKEAQDMYELMMKNSRSSVVSDGFMLQKRWFEDTVFTNQSVKEKVPKAGLTNDLLRSQYHKAKLKKFILN